MSSVPRVAAKLAHGGNVGNLLGVGVECEALGDLPDKDLAIIGGRGNHAIIERVPSNKSVSQKLRRRASMGCAALTSRCRGRQQCGPGTGESDQGASRAPLEG